MSHFAVYIFQLIKVYKIPPRGRGGGVSVLIPMSIKLPVKHKIFIK